METDVLLTYQSDGKVIESNYKKNPDGTISINTTDYEKTKNLIIDPYIGATYYGGNGNDEGKSIITDNDNNIFVTGSTMSTNFPLQNPGGNAYFQDTFAGGYFDAFILKFNSDGVRQWVTYYGGSGEYGWDVGNSITTDGNNNVIITGGTASINFPLQNPGGGAYFQNLIGSIGSGVPDAFIIKFNSNGVRQWATYYGGWYEDWGSSITSDEDNNIIVIGKASDSFPLYNPGGAYFQSTFGGYYDVFVLKFDSNGVRLWATYYGGDSWDSGNSVTTDGNNNILITGGTGSTNFPLQNLGSGAYFQDTLKGGDDIFVMKFDSSGVRQWATYYGGIGAERAYSIITDINNNILITGYSGYTDFPLQDPGGGAYYQDTIGGWSDAFLIKFNSSCIRIWSTYYGGNDYDYGNSITIDNNNGILITGYTKSTIFPLQNPGSGTYFQSTYAGGSYDAFILKFDSNGVRRWATFYGGNNTDEGYQVITDVDNNILVTGYTYSNNFPVFNPGGGSYFQGAKAGGSDAFILVFDSSGVVSNIHSLNKTILQRYALHQNYPNPFNPKTKIKFNINKSSYTKLIVYDMLGKEIATLVNEKLSAGSYEVDWNGSGYSSGVYFYKLITDEFVDIKKMLLIK